MNTAIQVIIKAKILLERLEEPSSSLLNACQDSLNLRLWTTNHLAEAKWEVQQVNKKQVSAKVSSSTEECVVLMHLTQAGDLLPTRTPFKLRFGCKGLRDRIYKMVCSRTTYKECNYIILKGPHKTLRSTISMITPKTWVAFKVAKCILHKPQAV